MAAKRNRYKEMEQMMTYVLAGDAGVFLLYLICAGAGIIWLKVITAIIAIAVAGLSLAFFYMNGELFRVRSRWMVVGFASVVLCLLVSLLFNYPSPAKEASKTPADNDGTLSIVAMQDFSI